MFVAGNEDEIAVLAGGGQQACLEVFIGLKGEVFTGSHRGAHSGIDRADDRQRDPEVLLDVGQGKQLMVCHEISAVRAVGIQRMVLGDHDVFIAVFLDGFFEEVQEIFPALTFAAVVDGRLGIPIGQPPFGVDKDDDQVIVDLNHVGPSAAVFRKPDSVVVQVVLHIIFLALHSFEAITAPIVITGDHEGLSRKIAQSF